MLPKRLDWEVCRRAVTEEEMQRVVESTVRIGPDSPAPEFDPDYQCPLEAASFATDVASAAFPGFCGCLLFGSL